MRVRLLVASIGLCVVSGLALHGRAFGQGVAASPAQSTPAAVPQTPAPQTPAPTLAAPLEPTLAAPLEPTPPPAPVLAVPEPAPAPLPPPSPATCTPACRAGFTCVEGQCVSACNPMCEAGSVCTAEGQCTPAQPGAPSGLRFFEGPLTARPPIDRNAHRHDGFMLRVALGLGGASSTKTNADVDSGVVRDHEHAQSTFHGGAGTLSVDLGGAVAENVMVHARLGSFVMQNPERLLDGAEYGDIDHTWVAAFLIAPAVTYYFMPINLYLTAAAGLSSIGLRYRNTIGEMREHGSGTGLGFNFDVGKEWWATSDLGIGVAGRFWYSRISDNDANGRIEYDFVAAGVLFSATYQ